MANEVEIDRMVARLIGDGSSYMKMVGDAKTGTLDLQKSIKGDLIPTINQISPAFKLVSTEAAVMKSALNGVTSTFKTLGDEITKTVKATALWKEKSIFEQVGSATSIKTYNDAIKNAFEGYRRELRNIKVEEGDLTRYINEREQQQERLIEARRKGMDNAFSERARTEGFAAADRGNIRDPAARMAAMRNALKEAEEVQKHLYAQAYASKDTNQFGGSETAKAKVGRLQSEYMQGAWSTLKSSITGGRDTHLEQLKDARKLQGDLVEREKEAEQVRRNIAHEIENEERARKRILDLAIEQSKIDLETARMSPQQQRFRGAFEHGASPQQAQELEKTYEMTKEARRIRDFIADADEEAKHLKQTLDEAYPGLTGQQSKIQQLRDLAGKGETNAGGIANGLEKQYARQMKQDEDAFLARMEEGVKELDMSARELRDKHMVSNLQDKSFSDPSIKRALDIQHEADKAKDQKELDDVVKALTEHLKDQSDALDDNVDILDKYADKLKNVSKTQREALRQQQQDLDIKKAEKHWDDFVKRDNERLQQSAESVKKSLRTPRQKMDDDIKDLGRLKNHGLSDSDYNKAVDKLRRENSERNPMRNEAVEAGSVEAQEHVDEYMKGAGQVGRSMSVAEQRAAKKQARINKAKERRAKLGTSGPIAWADTGEGGGHDDTPEVDVEAARQRLRKPRSGNSLKKTAQQMAEDERRQIAKEMTDSNEQRGKMGGGGEDDIAEILKRIEKALLQQGEDRIVLGRAEGF